MCERNIPMNHIVVESHYGGDRLWHLRDVRFFSCARRYGSDSGYLQSERDLSSAGVYIQSRERSIKRRHVHTKQAASNTYLASALELSQLDSKARAHSTKLTLARTTIVTQSTCQPREFCI